MDDQRLAELGQFTPEGALTPGYGDSYTFFAGHDDIHGIIMYLLKKETVGEKSNEYGFDDAEYNTLIMEKVQDPNFYLQMTLDKVQEAGPHEHSMVEADFKLDPTVSLNSIVPGQSATHQISHSKARVYMGLGMTCHGSVNLSSSGEGIGINLVPGGKNPSGFKAQNNTLTVSTNAVCFARMTAQLDIEHAIARAQVKLHNSTLAQVK